MNLKNKKKKYLLYGVIVALFVLSLVIYKVSTSADSGDNKIAIKDARLISVQTGTADFVADNLVEDGEGNITSYTAGADASADNRLVRSNDQITYAIGYKIGGKNDTNPYYSRTVNITVELSAEEANYVSFDSNAMPGETSHTYSYNNISSTSPENTSYITLYVLNVENGSELAPKFTIKESTDSDAGVILGKNGSNIEYEYENGSYTSTNVSPFNNYLPTIVSSTTAQNLNVSILPSGEGQKALYNNNVGRYFTGIVVVSTPTTKGSYVSSQDISLPVTISQSNASIEDAWVRLYNTETVGNIEPVTVEAPYSVGDGRTASNETRYPGTVSYSGGTLNVSGIKAAYNAPSVSAAGTTLSTSEKVLGTYAVSFFSPRTPDDGKDNFPVTLTVGSANTTFTNQYYESSDYNLTSGFFEKDGNNRLTTYVGPTGVVNLPSSTSKGDTIVYKNEFKYKKTLSNTGLKEIIKVDPVAFRVIPKSDKEDIDIEVSCGSDKCNVSKDDFEVKYVTKDWNNANYQKKELDSRISSENLNEVTVACDALTLTDLNPDQMMNVYGSPCVSEIDEVSYTKINDSRTEDDKEIPITKVIVQTKEGVNLPDDANVTVKVYLRVRNVADITKAYQAATTISTSDTDSELYYYAPGFDHVALPNNYTKNTFEGGIAILHDTVNYADSLRIVNFTARQDLTVTNKLSDGQVKTSFNVDENETIKYKLSTRIEDLNEQVGADDVWYIKSVGIDVFIPEELDYIQDDSLGTPTVTPVNGGVNLHYDLPWTKPNMKIPDIYFKTKLKNTLTGSRVPITVKSTINPININGERDMSVFDAKTTSFTIYGTASKTVLLSQSNEGKTVIDKDSEFTYVLSAFNNSGNAVENYVITDILPYDKDSRGSAFSGSYEVKVTLPSSQPTAKLYCSKKDAKTLSGESNNSEDGFEECTAGEFNKATAIRVTNINLAVDQTMDPIKVTIKPSKNKFGDKYVNNFIGGNRELKDRKSNDIEFNVISRTISGRIFKDANGDGIREESDQLVSGANVTLYKVQDGKTVETGKSTSTDKKGEYKFTNLDAGFYKVRIEYNSGAYDLTLRYGSENRATDSDAYKISEGLAEISGKNPPNTIDGIDLTVFENYKAEDMDMGLIPRVSFGFEMKKYITQVDLNYNSAVNTTKYNNESTVSLNVRNTLNATAKVYYGITIKNNSTSAGYVKLIQEDIPDGLIFDENDPYNKEWFKVGGVLQSNVLADKLLEPGDTTYLQIALNMPSRESGGTFINTVAMMDIEQYIPQELAKEAEFETDTYTIGEALDYAGVSWHVVGVEAGATDDEQIVTLLADHGTIPTKMAHSSSNIYKWGESQINSYINNTWPNTNSLNTPILKDQVVCNDSSSLEGNSYGGTLLSTGTCTSNDYVTTKIRLLTYEEYQAINAAFPSDKSWIYAEDFWLQNSVNSDIIHNVYGVQTNTDVNKLSTYAASVSGANTSITPAPSSSLKEVRPVITISSKNIIGQ